MKRMQRSLALAVVLATLAGCASAPPQMPVALSADSAGPGRVGVAMKKIPPVETSLPGAYCLLCVAAAAIANQGVMVYSKTLPYDDLSKLKEDVAALLRKKGVDAVVIAENVNVDALPTTGANAPNTSTRNFGELRVKYSIDRLLVLEIDALGFERPYQSYVPTGDPKAVVRGRGYLVDLKNNAYLWYQPVAIVRASDGPWDEPPKFPGLTNAYFQSIELTRDEFLQPFGR